MSKIYGILLITIASLVLLWGCNGSDIGLDLYMTSDSGATLSQALSNGNEDVTRIVVTLTGLEVHQTSAGQDSGWVALTTPSGSFDLMAIESVENLISSTEITAGSYNQIRFYVNTAIVTAASGTYNAEVPSEKINVAVQFEVKSGDVTEVVLAWDPDASLNKTGNNPPVYKLQPVIHVKRVKNPTLAAL
jgi:hypothetical protein